MITDCGTIKTPMGEIVCRLWTGFDYPCFDILLRREGGTEILLAVVEHDEYENHINIRTYGDLRDEEPDHMATINQDMIENYLKDMKG